MRFKLFVLMKDGEPLELPAADAETVHQLMGYDDGVDSEFAFASTSRPAIEAMRHTLRDLLDADDDWLGRVTIVEFASGWIVTGGSHFT